MAVHFMVMGSTGVPHSFCDRPGLSGLVTLCRSLSPTQADGQFLQTLDLAPLCDDEALLQILYVLQLSLDEARNQTGLSNPDVLHA